MKGKFSFFLLGIIFLCALSISTYGDEKEVQLYAAWEVIVHPSKYLDYEDAYKQLLNVYAEYNFPYTCYVYREDDFHYWFCMPIDNYEALDDINSHLERVGKAAGDDYQIPMNRMSSYCDAVNTGTVKVRWDLSHIPNEPRVNYGDWNFFWECYYYVKPGMEKEAEKILKEWQTLYKSHDIPDIVDVWVGDLWSEVPFFFMVIGGKSEADYYVQSEKNIELMGEQYWELMKRTHAICRKVVPKTGKFMWDLCYMPTKK